MHNLTEEVAEAYMVFIEQMRTICGWTLGGPRPHQNVIMTIDENDQSYNFPCRFPLRSFPPESSITSYGCILICDDEFLIVKRRDTPEYTDFIRGFYNWSQIYFYLQSMTVDEKDRLVSWSFDDLWEDLGHPQMDANDGYTFARDSFDEIIDNLQDIIDLIPVIPKNEADLWLFPKGRLEYNTCGTEEPEDKFHCALREFKEETNGIDVCEMDPVSRTPISEEYVGTNSKNYKTNYYVFSTQEKDHIDQFENVKGRIRDVPSGEIQEIKWVPIEDLPMYVNSRRLQIADISLKMTQNL